MALLTWWETWLERRPLLLYAATWTALLTAAVAATSVVPEVAFVWAVSPASSLAPPCDSRGGGGGKMIRIPIDVPGEVICLPAALLSRSALDLLVPPIFAAAVVSAAALLVRSLALWEDDEPAHPP